MPHSLPRVLVTQFSEKSSYKATAPTDLQKLVAEPQARVCAQFCRDASLKSFVKHTAATAFPKAHHCLSLFLLSSTKDMKKTLSLWQIMTEISNF